ncbi:MAG: flagellar basal-body MS-ring/collar protein FliF [Burkholderiales bacterium]|nr:flagellar basal-body MS-ring/collar protein FliF [Burkholderiales bacterium]
MATAVETAPKPSALTAFFQSPQGRYLALGAGMALVISIMASIWMWNQKPEYRVLVSNFSDRDGGAMIAALQTLNVPYRFAEGGGAILVPAEQVHDARLKLAAQGLPKGGNVGFELMENQKLGSSQFLEQVNFQRALEGELARSINSIGVVQAARVHLAIPKPSVFVRERQQPTASVLVNLHPGRTLDAQQVSAIVHLISSSVPELTAKNVTVVDQNGSLLSDPDRQADANRLDPAQVKYVMDLQDGIVKRIESILTPMVGGGNVRAEATAEVDFSRSEQAAETFRPNSPPEAAAIRSQSKNESNSEAKPAAGLVGAASNQPGAEASGAPTETPPGQAAASGNTQKGSTTNYEVDKTVRYVQQPMGGIKRLTVAVVVNHKRVVDAEGKVSLRALTEQEQQQITDLVKEAMGFNAERGDSLNVVNSPFAEAPREVIPEQPFWQPYATLDNAKTAAQYLLTTAVLLYLYFSVLRPMIRMLPGNKAKEEEAKRMAELKAEQEAQQKLKQEAQESQETKAESKPGETPATAAAPGTAAAAAPPNGLRISSYQDNLQAAKQMALQEPKVVANVVKNWVNGNE